MERTGFPTFLGKADRIDTGPPEPTGIEKFIDYFAKVFPHLLDWVVANGPGLPYHALSLRALTYRPRVAGFIDAEGVGRQAIEVSDSTGVGVRGYNRLREDAFRTPGVRTLGSSGAVAILRASGGNARGEEFVGCPHWNEKVETKM